MPACLSRGKLVNWLICQLPDVMGEAEIKSLTDHFYDPEKYLRKRLRDLKNAKRLADPIG